MHCLLTALSEAVIPWNVFLLSMIFSAAAEPSALILTLYLLHIHVFQYENLGIFCYNIMRYKEMML